MHLTKKDVIIFYRGYIMIYKEVRGYCFMVLCFELR